MWVLVRCGRCRVARGEQVAYVSFDFLNRSLAFAGCLIVFFVPATRLLIRSYRRVSDAARREPAGRYAGDGIDHGEEG